MGRKTKKQRAIELLQQLNQEDLKEVLDAFDVGSPNNSYENVEKLLRKECPSCHSTNHTKKGKNKLGLTRYRCKDCGRTYSILTDTPLENTQYDWNVWVTVLEKMLTNQSIKETRKYLINPYIKFSEEDGMWVVDKRTSINLLPEYKRRELAKALKIKPFSPIAVSSADLKKKLLAHPDLEDALYVLANGHTEDYR